MKHNGNGFSIDCPIHLKQRQTILENKKKINHSVRPVEKAIWAEDADTAINTLLNCNLYDNNSEHCRQCHLFAKKQKQLLENLIGAKISI